MKRVSLWSAIFAALTASALFAQTTGQLKGKVVDASAAALPGVTVTVASPAQIGGSKVTVSEADGSFSFPALAPGVYKLNANLDAFVPLAPEGGPARRARQTRTARTLGQA